MYDKELEFATKLAHEAGEIMRTHFGFSKTIWKSDNTPVTEADTIINSLVIERVKSEFPEDDIIGEEASHESGKARQWIVDPIDGTQAYDAGLPLATFSLGLADQGKIVLGIVLDPFSNTLFHAEIGQGAFMNGTKIRVSETSEVNQTYCFVSSRMSNLSLGEGANKLMAAGMKVFSIRSIAYSLMNLSRGKSVAVVGGASQLWDLAAASLIVTEAGGKISDIDGDDMHYDQADNGFVATNTHCHEQILKLLKQ